ncbi:hypothetical protein DXG01_003931 [Tephrocybe rancida]|nr:hypothetical protein DXG01_003931 [Tephrocybe rancida]
MSDTSATKSSLFPAKSWQHLVAGGDIYREESPRALFKGLGPTLVGVIPARSINFYTYGNGKHIIANYFNDGKENTYVHLTAAAIAGIVTGTATNPIWVVKTRLQLSATHREHGAGPRAIGSSWNTIKNIMKNEGIKGFYKGLSASYLGVTEGTIQWVLYERLKKISAATEGRGGIQEWLGMLGSAGTAKCIASLITYPHEVLRTRLRQPSVNGVVRYTGLVQTLRLVIAEEGARSLYGGLSAHLMRVVPNAAVMYSIYEGILRCSPQTSEIHDNVMNIDPTTQSQTLYIPTFSPPTPSPSPGPSRPSDSGLQVGTSSKPLSRLESPRSRRAFIDGVLDACTPDELLYISSRVAPMLKRDFLSVLPAELSLYILSLIQDPISLVHASRVSRVWRALAFNEALWRGACRMWGFGNGNGEGSVRGGELREEEEPLEEMEPYADLPMDPALVWLTERKRKARRLPSGSSSSSEVSLTRPFSYRVHFRESYSKLLRWKRGGRLLRTHRLPMLSASASVEQPPSMGMYPSHAPNNKEVPDTGVVTSIALDSDWVVVGLASSRIHVFSARTGVLARTLVGHDSGVWGLCLVSASQSRRTKRTQDQDEEELLSAQVRDLNLGSSSWTRTSRRTQESGGSAQGQGLCHLLPPALRAAVGLGPSSESDTDSTCPVKGAPADEAGYGLPRYAPERQSNPTFASEGWGQPNALVVSGGCDKVVRVWDVKSGHCIYTLGGHTSTIRCIRTLHSRPLTVTGSRDGTVRTWDIQRGVAVRVLEGHTGSVRCLDVNGRRAASGSYDTTCRVWDLDTGECLHVLLGHYHQVYTVAFDGVLVVTGGLDTSVRVWDAETGHCLALLQGHTALVCQLQISRKHQLLATGGSDGRIITFSLASSDSTVPSPPPLHERPKRTKTKRKKTMEPPDATSSPDSDGGSDVLSFQDRRDASEALQARRTAYEPLYRLAAHASSVTSLQFDGRFLMTAGNDGCVHLWETQTGRYVRRMTGEGEVMWKAGFAGGYANGEEAVGDVCVVAGKREGKTVLEIWGFGERGIRYPSACVKDRIVTSEDNLLIEADLLLPQLPWDGHIPEFATKIPVKSLCSYLTTEWLTDDHEATMFELLSYHATELLSSDSIRIQTPFFVSLLTAAYRNREQYESSKSYKWLRELGKDLTKPT